MFNGRTADDFVSKEDCEYIIKYAIEANAWSKTNDTFWNERVFYPENLPDDNEFKVKMSTILKKAKHFIMKEYSLDNVYADTFHVVRWMKDNFSQHTKMIWKMQCMMEIFLDIELMDQLYI